MSAVCRKCGAKCCRYFCFEIDTPESFDEYDDIRWFLLHENISVHIDKGDWYISIANRCEALDEDNRCRVYEDRPLICRKYSMSDCDFTDGHYGYDALFETPEQLEAYARKALGKKAYKKAKAKAYAKAERKRKKQRRKSRQAAG